MTARGPSTCRPAPFDFTSRPYPISSPSRFAGERRSAAERVLQAVLLGEHGVRRLFGLALDVHPPVQVADALVETLRAVQQRRKLMRQAVRALARAAADLLA